MSEAIRRIFFKQNIMNVGFCSFELLENRLLECRAKARIPKGARTVIMCLFPYKVKEESPKNISRYAAVGDYHKICGEYLHRAVEGLKESFPDNAFEPFIDNSPIPEVFAASAAGLGLCGDNGLLITPKYGTFVFLGSVVTDLYIPCENHYTECIHCGFCRNACPVGLQKERCLSKISQKKGELTADEQSLIYENGIIWGCDKCADVCPFNKTAETTYIKKFIDSYRDCYSFGEDITGRAYEWRGKETVERNYLINNEK